MRIGLVGYGAWGRMHAGAIARIPELSLAAVMCGSEASAACRRGGPSRCHRLPRSRRTAAATRPSTSSTSSRPTICTPRWRWRRSRPASMSCWRSRWRPRWPMPSASWPPPSARAATSAIGLELHVSKQWARVRELIAEGAIGRAALRQSHAVPPSLPARLRQLAAHQRSRRLVDPRGADPLYRSAAVVFPRTRAADRSVGRRRAVAAGGRHVRRVHLHAALRRRRLCGVFPMRRRLRAFPDARDRGRWRRAAHLVGRRDGPHARRRTSSSSCSAPAHREAEVVAIEKSGEVFELEEQLRRLVADVPRRTPLVSARDALPSLRICLEIERALCRAPRDHAGLDVTRYGTRGNQNCPWLNMRSVSIHDEVRRGLAEQRAGRGVGLTEGAANPYPAIDASAVLVVVARVGRKDPAQMGLAQDDDVIKALPADRAMGSSACPFCPVDRGAIG